MALLGARRCAPRRVATPAARAVLGHDRRRNERGAPNDDRRAGARACRPSRVSTATCRTGSWWRAVPDQPQSYRINDEPDQVAASRTASACSRASPTRRTRRALADVGIAPGWHCCDVGSGAGSVAAWMAEQVGSSGRVLSLDVDTRFQPPSAGVVEVRAIDVTTEPIGDERVRPRARAGAAPAPRAAGSRARRDDRGREAGRLDRRDRRRLDPVRRPAGTRSRSPRSPASSASSAAASTDTTARGAGC